jgi:two-component system, cell cycle sensor histidine kinase and response regulator CckA
MVQGYDVFMAVVLVAEDDSDVRKLACLILKMDGFEVLSAEDGVDALQVAEGAGALSLLVTDVRMPRMDGVELAHKLGGQHPHLKVIYMSGYTDVDIPLGSHCMFLPKPFSATALSKAVASMLD